MRSTSPSACWMRSSSKAYSARRLTDSCYSSMRPSPEPRQSGNAHPDYRKDSARACARKCAPPPRTCRAAIGRARIRSCTGETAGCRSCPRAAGPRSSCRGTIRRFETPSHSDGSPPPVVRRIPGCRDEHERPGSEDRCVQNGGIQQPPSAVDRFSSYLVSLVPPAPPCLGQFQKGRLLAAFRAGGHGLEAVHKAGLAVVGGAHLAHVLFPFGSAACPPIAVSARSKFASAAS